MIGKSRGGPRLWWLDLATMVELIDGWLSVVIIGAMDSRAIIKRLEADGWALVRVRGSHHQFKHPDRPGLVTVKHPDKDIPMGTLRNIERQAGWRSS